MALGACIVAAAVAGFILERRFFHDDTYISLRYAANFLEFGQLVWNRDEWVEGYTNFLHLLCVIGLGALGVDLPRAAQLVNVASYAGLVLGLVWCLRRLRLGGYALAAAALLVGNWSLIVWVYGGLEAPMTAAFVLPCFALLLATPDHPVPSARAAALAGLMAALAVLTRPDTVLLGIVAGASLLTLALPWRRKAVLSAAFALAPILLVGGHTLWRLHVYGDLMPNTSYAKLAGNPVDRVLSGLFYVAKSLIVPPFSLPVAAAATAIAWFGPARRNALLLGAGIAVYVAYIVWTGGDHMAHHRFLVPILPLAAILAALAIEGLRRKRAFAWGLAVAALLQFLLPPMDRDPAAWLGELVGRHIARAWPSGSLIALHTAGSTPYFNRDKRFIDMLGLTDRHIARRDVGDPILRWQEIPGHAKGDGAYVLARKPDFVIAGPADGSNIDRAWFLSDYELHRLPEFDACYRIEFVPLYYGPAYAALSRPRFNPIIFAYYRRIC